MPIFTFNKKIPTPLTKTDKNGEYTYFPGVNVISSCYNSHPEFCEKIHHLLVNNKYVMEYYSPLPATSYHLTVMDIYTAENIQRKGYNWSDFITKNLSELREIALDFNKKPFQPEVLKIEIHIGWVIMLSVTLSDEIQAQIKETAQRLGLQDSVPKAFHITLGYSRPNKKIPAEIKDAFKKELFNQLNAVVETAKLPTHLANPKLCYFTQMTDFKEWTAQTNPFVSPKRPTLFPFWKKTTGVSSAPDLVAGL